jgi:hypothetical protein
LDFRNPTLIMNRAPPLASEYGKLARPWCPDDVVRGTASSGHFTGS